MHVDNIIICLFQWHHVWREKKHDTSIRMENDEGISQSGWCDERSDFVEEGLGWLDHKYAG